jgi:hypothetical protein
MIASRRTSSPFFIESAPPTTPFVPLAFEGPPLSRPDTEDAEVSEEDDWAEDTARYVDVPRVLQGLLALVSRTESLASAAERAFDVLDAGSTAGYACRSRRIADLLAALRESALRALEVGEELRVEIARLA